MAVCDKDRFNCPYDDCVLDELDAEDYAQTREIEGALLFPKTAAQKKIAAYQRAYREANKDKIAAKKRAYYQKKKAARLAAEGVS